jgi:galactonate dehydratase
MLGVPNLYRVEILGIQAMQAYNECLQEPMDIRDGQLFLSDRPGLGVELNREYLRANPHPDWP